jgi:hypothetical protein
MFSPYEDLSAVWQKLSGDAELLALMGLTGKSQVDIAKAIVKRNTVDGLVSDKRLCIYFRPSRRTRYSDLSTEEVLEIDCHCPNGQDSTAYKVIARVNKLLHKAEINNKQLSFDGQLGDLATAQGFFCVGARFCFYSLI